MPLSHARLISAITVAVMLLLSAVVQANDKADLVASSQQALVKLRNHASGAGSLLDKAAGVLVYPDVVKVGFGGAAEYGEGCLLVDGKAVAFFSTSGATFGLPLGAGVKSEAVLFMTAQALQDFRASQTWKVGVDGDVVMVRVASGGGVDAASIDEPIIGFVFSDKGLENKLTLADGKFTRIAR